MADQRVQIEYLIDDSNATSALGNIQNSAERTESASQRLFGALSKIGGVGLGINFVTSCFGKLYNVMQSCESGYRSQMEAETKLESAMRNTMGATEEDVKLIKELTSAQQALGVVGDEVQLAGAQELSTFLRKRESLESLIPVMNDMIVQQYGLNASQESAAGIATLLGKVMNGQTSALTRYGYSFTEAQEKILKFGTEEQKAATLAEVITSRVGGMNEAMAQTDAGRLQQYNNSMGDLGERLGGLYTRIQAALLPAMNRTADLLGKIIGFVEAHMDTITGVISGTIQAIQEIGSTLIDLWPVITGVATAVGVLTVAAQAMAIKAAIVTTAIKLCTTATKLWTTAQAILNAVMTANPIGLIIAAIAVLVGAIVWVSKHTEGWGTLWDAVCTFMKESFYAYVDGVKLYFNTLVNGIMIGLDKIKLGWYKFKEACGIGDSEENKRAISEINAQVEARQKAIADGAKKMMEHVNNARHAFDNVSIKWKGKEETAESGGTNSQIKAGAGFGTGAPFATAGLTGSANAKSSAEAIASGGSRNTQITINFSKEMVRMEFTGGYLDNHAEVETTLEESLLRVLSAAKASI